MSLLTCFFLFGLWMPKISAAIEELRVPKGFQIHLYSDNVPDARQMALGSMGTLFVGSRREGRVYAVIDENNDFVADDTVVVADRLLMPSGIAFKGQDLYVAAVNRVLRYRDIEVNLGKSVVPEIITDELPKETHHGWKFIRFGPDGKLYLPIGMPCNICEFEQPVFGTIMSLDVLTKTWSLIAQGVRNSVGFDWHPESGVLWFSENGRDNIGDDIPPDEINRVTERGEHFGFPYVYGDNIPQPEFLSHKERNFEKPALNLQAHVAPLGIHFYRGAMFPEHYQNVLFVAEHGSWNRSKKVGYRVMMARIENGKVISYEPFVEGWLKGEKASGRPVAFLELNDGSLLVSDDHAGVIYRITYRQ